MPQSVSNQEQTALMQSPFKDLEEWKAARHKYVARDPNVCNAQQLKEDAVYRYRSADTLYKDAEWLRGCLITQHLKDVTSSAKKEFEKKYPKNTLK